MTPITHDLQNGTIISYSPARLSDGQITAVVVSVMTEGQTTAMQTVSGLVAQSLWSLLAELQLIQASQRAAASVPPDSPGSLHEEFKAEDYAKDEPHTLGEACQVLMDQPAGTEITTAYNPKTGKREVASVKKPARKSRTKQAKG